MCEPDSCRALTCSSLRGLEEFALPAKRSRDRLQTATAAIVIRGICLVVLKTYRKADAAVLENRSRLLRLETPLQWLVVIYLLFIQVYAMPVGISLVYAVVQERRLPMLSSHTLRFMHRQGTICTPIVPACDITLLTIASNPMPDNRVSDLFILAISYTCLRLTAPTYPMPAFPGWPAGLAALPLPSAPTFELGPAVLPAPFNLPLIGATPAAERRRDDVGGVRSSKVKERSGRTVTRAGMGVPST